MKGADGRLEEMRSEETARKGGERLKIESDRWKMRMLGVGREGVEREGHD